MSNFWKCDFKHRCEILAYWLKWLHLSLLESDKFRKLWVHGAIRFYRVFCNDFGIAEQLLNTNLHEEFQSQRTRHIDLPDHLLNCWLHEKTDNRTEYMLLMLRVGRSVSSSPLHSKLSLSDVRFRHAGCYRSTRLVEATPGISARTDRTNWDFLRFPCSSAGEFGMPFQPLQLLRLV